MAAHGGHDERIGAGFAQRAHALAHHEGEIRDPPARAGHRDPLTGPDVGENRRHLPTHRRGEVRLDGAGKPLPELEHGRDIGLADSGVGVVEQEAGGILHGVELPCMDV